MGTPSSTQVWKLVTVLDRLEITYDPTFTPLSKYSAALSDSDIEQLVKLMKNILTRRLDEEIREHT